MEPRVEVIDASKAARMLDVVGDQAPFALSVTLNELANTTQAVVKDSLDDWATLRRRDFMRNTVYRQRGEDFATKAKPVAGVRINPERNWLAKFEDGGTKENPEGKRIAIPVDVRRNKKDIVTAANRPRALLDKKNVALVGNAIVQRLKQGAASATRLLYLLKPAVVVKPKLRMAEQARDVMRTDFVPIASAAMDRALNTAKRTP